MTERRARLPAVDRVLRSDEGGALIAQYGRPLVLDAVQKALAERRRCGVSYTGAFIRNCKGVVTTMILAARFSHNAYPFCATRLRRAGATGCAGSATPGSAWGGERSFVPDF
jgi:hypothetical protein